VTQDGSGVRLSPDETLHRAGARDGDHLRVGILATAGGGWTVAEEIAAGFLALRVLGPFAEAFASKLGERTGESVASAVSKIRLFRRRRPSRDEFVIRHSNASTFVVLPAAMTDDARLALIDLDLTQAGIIGKILHWDAVSATWRPFDNGNADGSASKIVLQDLATGARKEIGVLPGMTVRQAAERGAPVAHDTGFTITDSGGTVVDEFPSTYFGDEVLYVCGDISG
jgi:hypothetical protein